MNDEKSYIKQLEESFRYYRNTRTQEKKGLLII